MSMLKGKKKRFASGSLEADVVHRRGFIKKVPVSTGMLLPCIVLSGVDSASSSIVAWYSGCCYHEFLGPRLGIREATYCVLAT